MKSLRVQMLGCGDIGTAVALRLKSLGHQPLAVRRTIESLPPELEALSLDYSSPAGVAALAERDCEAVIMTPTPTGRDAAGYRAGFLQPVLNLLDLWQSGPAKTVLYVSSTRVYGDAGGAWVDESSAPNPADEQGELMLEAEQALLDSRHDVSIVRFTGIYGRQPSRLLQRIARGEIVKPRPPHYSNRIHRDDCVGFLMHLLELPRRQPIYLATDDEPTLSAEVERWLATRLGVEGPRECIEPPGASRRCRNTRLRESGYALRYPDYRSGYSAMITSTSMSAPLGNAAT